MPKIFLRSIAFTTIAAAGLSACKKDPGTNTVIAPVPVGDTSVYFRVDTFAGSVYYSDGDEFSPERDTTYSDTLYLFIYRRPVAGLLVTDNQRKLEFEYFTWHRHVTTMATSHLIDTMAYEKKAFRDGSSKVGSSLTIRGDSVFFHRSYHFGLGGIGYLDFKGRSLN